MEKNRFKVAEVGLTYTPNYKIADRPQITSASHAHQLLIAHWQLNRINLLEEFKMILLNRRNRVLGIVDISIGGVAGTVVDPKIVFAVALKANASAIILCHNHPSGELDPSEQDIALTKRLQRGAELLEIKIFDHVIINESEYYSFSDEGRL